jgi:hypothetical protein
MAYVVARPKGRFEIRESVHTRKGPRARSLANFARLTDEVLAVARQRATRPFDPDLVLAAAARAGTPGAVAAAAPTPGARRAQRQRFVESSRRMARSLEPRPTGEHPDPGDALIDLLGFVAQIAPFRPARAGEPLRFPPLARLRAERQSRTAPR